MEHLQLVESRVTTTCTQLSGQVSHQFLRGDLLKIKHGGEEVLAHNVEHDCIVELQVIIKHLDHK